MQRNILNKGFLQNFTALIIAVLLIVGASIMNLSRPEPLFAASCSVFNGDQSSCETTSGCTWSGSCSIYNGDSNACQAASGSGCSYPGNTGDCSIFSDTSSCNAQYGCSASTYSCTWDSEFSTCGGTDTNCTSYTDENTCIAEHFTSCSGTYDTGECSGTLNPGVCSGNFDDVAPTLVSAIADYETVVLTYNESLDESTNVSTEVYVLNVNNTQTGIDLVTVSGSTVILNLSQSVGAGSSITLHYTAGMSPIQDTSGNQAESFSSQEVVNDTAYTLSGISPSSGSVINSITTNSDVEYTINRSALTSGTITITRTGGSIDNGSPHVCNMMNTALSAGTHDNFDFSDLSNGCQYAIGDLVDQAVYTFVFEGIDNQSNVVEPITITDVVFDNTAPVAPSIPDLDAQSDSGYSS
ncbi:MAG: hypothetical protein QG568_524, partial [Patescibacteria group bacterium]|nr:hypothetical protein [Patescibacteria group bacterium]